VLIDDGPGARIATSEISRLQRLRANCRAVGSIKLASTLTVLEHAAGSQHIPDKATMRDIYKRLRGLDDGLPAGRDDQPPVVGPVVATGCGLITGGALSQAVTLPVAGTAAMVISGP
jgi:hypothetical protein